MHWESIPGKGGVVLQGILEYREHGLTGFLEYMVDADKTARL